MKRQLSAPTKPVKPKSNKPSGLDKRPWYIVAAVLFGMLFASIVVANVVSVATRVVDGAANAALQTSVGAAQAFGQVISIGIAQVLVAGEDAQRIELLSQLSETEFESSAPDYLIDCVQLNLTHDNVEVRTSADKVWQRIKNLERAKTNITISDGKIAQDGQVIPSPANKKSLGENPADF